MHIIAKVKIDQNKFLQHCGTMIGAEAACKKIPFICTAQLGEGALLKIIKYFKFLLNIFEFSRV